MENEKVTVTCNGESFEIDKADLGDFCDAHTHEYNSDGICSICGYIKYMSPAYCELHGVDPW